MLFYFRFEKLFAGKYVGEIVRQHLHCLIKEDVLPEKFTNWNITAADVSNIIE